MWDSEIPLQGQYSLSKTRLLVKFHYPTLVRINGSISISLICTFFWGGGGHSRHCVTSSFTVNIQFDFFVFSLIAFS